MWQWLALQWFRQHRCQFDSVLESFALRQYQLVTAHLASFEYFGLAGPVDLGPQGNTLQEKMSA